jgi:hypothetical protein
MNVPTVILRPRDASHLVIQVRVLVAIVEIVVKHGNKLPKTNSIFHYMSEERAHCTVREKNR